MKFSVADTTHVIVCEGNNGLIPCGRADEKTVASVKVLSLEFQEIPTSGRCLVVHRDELKKLSGRTIQLIKKAIVEESRNRHEEG